MNRPPSAMRLCSGSSLAQARLETPERRVIVE
jgi:hypothetical protein